MSTADFEAFTRAFFDALGQPVSEADGRLLVALSGELAEAFGSADLCLTFKAHDAGGELVAYGSRAFEAMQGYLATRGRHAACRLPEAERAAAPLTLVNGEALRFEGSPRPRHYYLVNFHLTFLSDERSEKLLSFCLAEDGGVASEAAEWLEAAGGGEPLAGAIAVPEPVLAAAERLALDEAERLALPIEEAVLARLARAADRLTGYYEEQIDDVGAKRRRGMSEDEALEAAFEERRFLRRELERKLAEETSRHQLRVQVRRISQAVVAVPGTEHRYQLATAHARRQECYWENRHTATAEYPACERCGSATGTAGLCAEGHLTCPGCLGGCASCHQDRCEAELVDCHACGEAACEACRGTCTTGHAVCRHHLAPCACCGQVFCGGCTGSCAGCESGARLAKAHAESCAVCASPVCEAHLRSCGWCAGRLCERDTARCPGCGDGVCISHLEACEHCELAYCTRCRDESRACRACAVVGQAPRAREAWLACLAELPDAGRYGHWNGIENEGYRYLLGRGLLGDLLVVTDHDGRLLKTREIGFWQRLFRYF